ncbi:MAG TPA: hypothetical protein VD905_12175 [Flavobacteriales bacterium]|nr:hypothetical protein [Flavobacteriales bacterium]
MIVIPVLLLALLVLLAGLFMLAKARKENLGRAYIWASYVAAGFGVLVFVFGITAGILMAIFHSKHGGHMPCGKRMHCPMIQGCGSMQMHGGKCEGACGGNCSEAGMPNCAGNCSEGMCGHGHMKMKGDCCPGTNHESCCADGKKIKEVIIKHEGDEKPGVNAEEKTK